MADNVQPVGNNKFLGLKSVIDKRKEKEQEKKPPRKKKQNQEESDQDKKADRNEDSIKRSDGGLIDLEA